MTPTEKLAAKIASHTTEALVEMSFALATRTDIEAIIVACKIDNELGTRLSTSDFVAHCEAIEAILDQAA